MLKFVIGTVLGSGIFKDGLKTMAESGMTARLYSPQLLSPYDKAERRLLPAVGT